MENSYLGAGARVIDALAIVLACIVFVSIRNRVVRKGLPLPPGPRGLPIIGNALDIPKERPWLAFRDLSAKHGDVVSLHALGQTIVVLSSVSAAIDLFEKRSAIYSDRQDSVLAHLTGWTWNLAFKRYNDDWRRVRRLFWQHFQPSAVGQFKVVQRREAYDLLRRLLDDQRDIDSTIKLSLSKTILTSVHGLPGAQVTRHYVDILNASEHGIAEAFTPGAYLVEFLPWLRYIPAWFPGTGWQKKLAEWRTQAAAIREDPYRAAKEAMAQGEAEPSMITELMEKLSDGELDEKTVKETTAVAFGAGTDTTAATLVAFICAMILHPTVQARAHAELDRVIGTARLPEHADRAALPYVDAIVKEMLRWHNVAPLGVAHRCMEEDVYCGWRIPKGAIIMSNAWAILNDPEVFPDPETFRPERFLTANGQPNADILDPASVAFGFGRRICPGRHFATDALFINIASLLHVFDFQPALDAHGDPIPVEAKMTTNAFLSYLEHFEYLIRPRSLSAEALIRAEPDSAQ
ncbi:CyP450 monooxygenase [Cubamyces sp. BRFM 1775]|nr:CyP450 monooxygenase [Cubamyces sp. BRFM 1775]